MRIAHISPVYPPYKGGMGKVAESSVLALRKRGFDAIGFSPRYRSISDRADICYLKPVAAFGNGALLPQLFFRLKEFDILHLHYPFYGGAFFVALAAKVWRKPLFITYHMKTQGSGWLGMFFRLHRFFLEPFILHSARRIFVSSFDYAKSNHLSFCTLRELPIGVDTKRFSPSARKPEIPTFLFVGGLDKAHYFKGLDVLLRAASELPKEEEWKILIVGEGSERAGFEKLTRELSLANRVQFLGNLSEEELPNAYRHSSVHILPSIDRSEAYGLVTLEAAASGLPSIVSDLPGVRSLVDDRKTGLLIPPKDQAALHKAMLDFLQDQATFLKMGEAAHLRVTQKYDENDLVEELIREYKGEKSEVRMRHV